MVFFCFLIWPVSILTMILCSKILSKTLWLVCKNSEEALCNENLLLYGNILLFAIIFINVLLTIELLHFVLKVGWEYQYRKLEHLSSFPVFSGVWSLDWCICFVYHCLSFWTFSFGHCVVCSSLIYRLWIPLWYLQTFLSVGLTTFVLCPRATIIYMTCQRIVYRNLFTMTLSVVFYLIDFILSWRQSERRYHAVSLVYFTSNFR
jgi:hypothetical protein